MENYIEGLSVGLPIIYDGEEICWCNRKGTIVERFKRGYYVVSQLSDKYVWLKADRKNAVTEHRFDRKEIEGVLKKLTFADVTTTAGFIGLNFLNTSWVYNDKELIKKAKAYNRGMMI